MYRLTVPYLRGNRPLLVRCTRQCEVSINVTCFYYLHPARAYALNQQCHLQYLTSLLNGCILSMLFVCLFFLCLPRTLKTM